MIILNFQILKYVDNIRWKMLHNFAFLWIKIILLNLKCGYNFSTLLVNKDWKT